MDLGHRPSPFRLPVFSEVDMLGSQYKVVNFRAETHPLPIAPPLRPVTGGQSRGADCTPLRPVALAVVSARSAPECLTGHLDFPACSNTPIDFEEYRIALDFLKCGCCESFLLKMDQPLIVPWRV